MKYLKSAVIQTFVQFYQMQLITSEVHQCTSVQILFNGTAWVQWKHTTDEEQYVSALRYQFISLCFESASSDKWKIFRRFAGTATTDEKDRSEKFIYRGQEWLRRKDGNSKFYTIENYVKERPIDKKKGKESEWHPATKKHLMRKWK